MRSAAVRAAVSAARYSRQIVTIGVGAPANDAANGSFNVPWPTSAGSVAANVRNFLAVSLKPGTANGGSVATPSGWTPIGDHIGGGYGSSIGAGTGNSRIYLFYKDNDNTASGNVAVSYIANGGNAIAAAVINRVEKLKGSWQTIVTATGEATADVIAGVYTPSSLLVAPGDLLIYAWGIGAHFSPSGSAVFTTSADLATWSPSLAGGVSLGTGYHGGVVSTGRRVKRTQTLPAQTLTLPTGICRGPMIVARLRVR